MGLVTCGLSDMWASLIVTRGSHLVTRGSHLVTCGPHLYLVTCGLILSHMWASLILSDMWASLILSDLWTAVVASLISAQTCSCTTLFSKYVRHYIPIYHKWPWPKPACSRMPNLVIGHIVYSCYCYSYINNVYFFNNSINASMG